MRQLIVIFALTAILGGCSSEGDRGSSPGTSEYRDSQKVSAHEPATVEIQAHQFSPREVTIRAGESVLWKNTSNETHTVTGDPSKAGNRDDVSLPAGAKPFHSGDLRPGKTFRQTFTMAGTYRYVCTVHEGHGMMGTVVVRPAEPQTR